MNEKTISKGLFFKPKLLTLNFTTFETRLHVYPCFLVRLWITSAECVTSLKWHDSLLGPYSKQVNSLWSTMHHWRHRPGTSLLWGLSCPCLPAVLAQTPIAASSPVRTTKMSPGIATWFSPLGGSRGKLSALLLVEDLCSKDLEVCLHCNTKVLITLLQQATWCWALLQVRIFQRCLQIACQTDLTSTRESRHSVPAGLHFECSGNRKQNGTFCLQDWNL